MTILDLNHPFAREAWAEVDAVDEAVGLDPAMFPFPEKPRDFMPGGVFPASTYGVNCRCRICYEDIREAQRHYRTECKDKPVSKRAEDYDRWG